MKKKNKRFARLDARRFGPWAVVTGASSGIGREAAHQVAANGLNLVLVARRGEVLARLGEELARHYGIVFRVIEADLSQPGAEDVLIAGTADIDVGLFFSCAGTGQPGAFLAFNSEQLREIVQLNGLSHLLLTHHFSQRFARRGRGGTLLVSALGADSGIPFHAVPAASKGLVNTLGRSLHSELKRSGVGISVLIVTPTDTPLVTKMGLDGAAMPMKPMPVEQCVREALEGLSRNKMIIMPGLVFRIMNRIMPHGLVRAMTADMMRKSTTFVS
ncbi:SDR family NAD(P)-dependent oxidoreductase [Pelagibacterium lentulum]|uniref:Short-chain dehydrogenase n=1 Tax=Pelagibacterium lentulum TaxID=2029865 RepID=A0A916RCU9_9HYPH|nr:SDR family NAD(P)-dependent oxidoreductase [Pelagibacterium lentulum]GGA45559.1 short-chain dehydrogenase [Pelagibacterium lentulum]